MNQLTKILLEDILEIKNQDYIIYFDIDDTLTDYSNRLGNMIITDPETGEKRPIKASDTVDNKEFWTTAKWLPGSKEMLDFAKNNFSNVEILSAVPELSKANKELTGKRFFDAPVDGKTEWLNKNVGPIKTIWTKSGKEKAIYATPNTVLVDDKPENVIAFEKAGGIGILMDTPQNAINKLNDLLEGKDMIKEGFMDNIKSKFSNFIKAEKTINCGLATDGDADRIGLYNSKGAFVDSHHIILLLIHYLVKYKGIKGKVVTAFSTTSRIKTLCQHYGLEMETVKIGFKYICAIMVREDVLLGGEESGGIAIKGHIPERDGIWMGLTLWEFMSKTGKSLEALIDEVYAITGSFHFDRLDLHISETQKQSVLQRCEQDTIQAFGRYSILKRETLDGYKYFISETSWIMIRASGTEPILRIYAEGSNEYEVSQLLEAARHTLLN